MDMDSSSHNLIVGAAVHRVSTKYQLGRRDKARVKHSSRQTDAVPAATMDSGDIHLSHCNVHEQN